MQKDTGTAIENLNRRGFKAVFFEDSGEALAYVISEAGNADIGIGGSTTIAELGWYDALAKRGNVHWHAKTPEDPGTIGRAGASPCYMLSANAVSGEGDIINIDGNGNRVAAAAYGPKKVFYVCGENKIAKDAEAALWRAKNVAAPMNARRLKRKTPCAAAADKCHNCSSPERICRVTTITARPPNGMEAHVIFIGGSLGF